MAMRRLLVLLLSSSAAANMLPPSSASSVQPRPPLPGLAVPSADGLGLTLTGRLTRRGASGQGLEIWRVAAQLDREILPRLTAIVSLPVVSARFVSPDATAAYTSAGDAVVLGRWAAFRRKRAELGILAGAKLPTGATELSRGGSKLAATQQPGSGTFDAILGLAGYGPLGGASLYGAAVYKLNSRLAYTFGDQFSADLGVNAPIAGRWSATGEANLELTARDRSLERGAGVAADGTVSATGGETLYLTPGVQRRLGARSAVFASVQLPVHQRLNGAQLRAAPNWQGGFLTRF
jgi:hypothetical protein